MFDSISASLGKLNINSLSNPFTAESLPQPPQIPKGIHIAMQLPQGLSTQEMFERKSLYNKQVNGEITPKEEERLSKLDKINLVFEMEMEKYKECIKVAVMERNNQKAVQMQQTVRGFVCRRKLVAMIREKALIELQSAVNKLIKVGYHPVSITTFAASDSVSSAQVMKLTSQRQGKRPKKYLDFSYQLKSLNLPSSKNKPFYSAVEQITNTFENGGRGGGAEESGGGGGGGFDDDGTKKAVVLAVTTGLKLLTVLADNKSNKNDPSKDAATTPKNNRKR